MQAACLTRHSCSVSRLAGKLRLFLLLPVVYTYCCTWKFYCQIFRYSAVKPTATDHWLHSLRDFVQHHRIGRNSIHTCLAMIIEDWPIIPQVTSCEHSLVFSSKPSAPCVVNITIAQKCLYSVDQALIPGKNSTLLPSSSSPAAVTFAGGWRSSSVNAWRMKFSDLHLVERYEHM